MSEFQNRDLKALPSPEEQAARRAVKREALRARALEIAEREAMTPEERAAAEDDYCSRRVECSRPSFDGLCRCRRDYGRGRERTR